MSILPVEFFFPRATSMPCLFPLLTIPLSFFSPIFHILDLLILIVIRRRSCSSSSLGFEAWMYSLPS